MRCYNKKELRQVLEDVINELELSDSMIEEHGPLGTPPAQLVRLVLKQKNRKIQMLRAELINVSSVS